MSEQSNELAIKHLHVAEQAGRKHYFTWRSVANACGFELDDVISIATEGLINASRSFESSRGVPFPAYARIRMRGAVLDAFRAHGPLPEASRDVEPPAVDQLTPLVDQMGDAEALLEAMANLTIEEMELFLAYVVDGLTMRELAAKHSFSLGTIHTMISRAKRKLANSYTEIMAVL